MTVRAVKITAVVLLLFGGILNAGEIYPRVSDYDIEAKFYPEESRMEGKAGVRFAADQYPVGKVTLYLHGEVRIDSIIAGGRPIEAEQNVVFYDYDYSLVALKCDFDLQGITEKSRIDICYSGYFNPSRASSPSDYMRIDDNGVYLRSYGYSLWFPIFLEARKDDYKADFTKVKLITPAGYHSIFAGKKIKEYTEGDWQVSEWTATELPLFDAQCTAHRYEILKSDSVSVYYWKDAASTEMARTIADYTVRLGELYREMYRPDVVGGQLHIMEMPKYGNISSGNVVGISDDIWINFENEVYPQTTLAHELVHMYVSADIPRSDPLYSMVIEGFPSYFDHPALAVILGEEWYEKRMEKIEAKYLKFKSTGLSRRGNKLPVEKPIDQILPDEIGTYKDLFVLDDRAMLFFNYLRVKAGEEKFRGFCKKLFESGSIDNESFRTMASEFCGVSRPDIDIWLSSNDYPDKFKLENLE